MYSCLYENRIQARLTLKLLTLILSSSDYQFSFMTIVPKQSLQYTPIVLLSNRNQRCQLSPLN